MNKSDLVKVVAERVGLTQKDVAAVVDAMIDVTTRTLVKGDEVSVAGLGKFVVRKYKIDTNPKDNDFWNQKLFSECDSIEDALFDDGEKMGSKKRSGKKQKESKNKQAILLVIFSRFDPLETKLSKREDLIENCGYRLTSPGLGKEVGASLGVIQSFYQGFFLAPTVTAGALKGAIFAANIYYCTLY